MFAVTNYWESKNADVEMKQGKAMADAAKVILEMLTPRLATNLES